MPAATAPYGLVPVNLIGGQVYAGSTRQIPIESAMPTSIFFGDCVAIGATGTIIRATGTTAVQAVGVFLGCTYTDATYGLTFRQMYTGATTASDIMAYVADDPDLLFKVAVCASASTTISFLTRTDVGSNVALVNNAGVAATGNSRQAILNSSATTSTLPFRIVDTVSDSGTAGNPGSFTEMIVKWNGVQGTTGGHQYLQPTGI